MENQFCENQPTNKENNYYSDKSKRVKDITIGFFGGLAFWITALGFFFSLKNIFTVLWIVIIINLLAIALFIFLKRYYISIGIILLATIPPAILGGCLLLIRQYNIKYRCSPQ
jgi:hypothetical protein